MRPTGYELPGPVRNPGGVFGPRVTELPGWTVTLEGFSAYGLRNCGGQPVTLEGFLLTGYGLPNRIRNMLDDFGPCVTGRDRKTWNCFESCVRTRSLIRWVVQPTCYGVPEQFVTCGVVLVRVLRTGDLVSSRTIPNDVLRHVLTTRGRRHRKLSQTCPSNWRT